MVVLKISRNVLRQRISDAMMGWDKNTKIERVIVIIEELMREINVEKEKELEAQEENRPKAHIY